MTLKKKINSLSERKKNSIIKHATRLFLKKGFGSISMDEISEAAGVSKRTLYNHFPTKKILFREIVKIEWQKIGYKKNSSSPVSDPEKMFTAIMNHIMAVMYSPRMTDLLRLVIRESSKFPELISLQAEYGVEPLFNDFKNYVQRLGESGVLNVDNPGIAAAQYIGLVKEYLYWPWFFGMRPKPTEKVQKDAIRRANEIFFGHYGRK